MLPGNGGFAGCGGSPSAGGSLPRGSSSSSTHIFPWLQQQLLLVCVQGTSLSFPTTKVRLTPLPASSSLAFSAETMLPRHDVGGMEFNRARKLPPLFFLCTQDTQFSSANDPTMHESGRQENERYDMLCEQNCDSFLDKVDVGQCIFLRKKEIYTVLSQLDRLGEGLL